MSTTAIMIIGLTSGKRGHSCPPLVLRSREYDEKSTYSLLLCCGRRRGSRRRIWSKPPRVFLYAQAPLGLIGCPITSKFLPGTQQPGRQFARALGLLFNPPQLFSGPASSRPEKTLPPVCADCVIQWGENN